VTLQTRSSTPSICDSKLALRLPACPSPNLLDHSLHWASPNSHDDGLGVHLQSRLITASECIPQLALLWPLSVSRKYQNDGHHVRLETRTGTACKCISKLARSRSPGASLHLHHLALQVRVQTRSITASKCISQLVPLWHPNLLNHGLAVHLSFHTIMLWLKNGACIISKANSSD
jgi:hypothetical protein